MVRWPSALWSYGLMAHQAQWLYGAMALRLYNLMAQVPMARMPNGHMTLWPYGLMVL